MSFLVDSNTPEDDKETSPHFELFFHKETDFKSTNQVVDEVKPNEYPISQSRTEYFLQRSAGFRRICLKIDADNKIEKSHHESNSDTIFWSVLIRFMTSQSKIVAFKSSALQQLSTYDSDNEMTTESVEKADEFSIDTAATIPKTTELSECCSHLVHEIPESLRVCTLVKQFVRPRLNGPVISSADLDLEKLSVFLDSPDSCLVYMPVNINGNTKYIPIDQEKSILDNLRNRTVNGHPEFIVCLNTDAFEFERPNQSDLGANQSNFHQHFNNNNNNYRVRQFLTNYYSYFNLIPETSPKQPKFQ